MKNHRRYLFFLTFFWISLFLPEISWPQLILGQYEDEAAFRTWNSLGVPTASFLALGESRFTLARDCSASLTNPALLTYLPKITATFSTSLNSASFFKYSLVNTGVVQTDGNLSHTFLSLDFAGISLRLGNWAFAISRGLIECYSRPSVESQYYDKGNLSYFLRFQQEGVLVNTNLSISRKLISRLSAGIGFNFINGHLKKAIFDKWTLTDVSITDRKLHDFKGFYINGGFSLDISDKIVLAAIFRTPFVKKTDSQSLLRYESHQENIDIKIEASSRNTYQQPLVLGIGASYKFSRELRFISDFTFFNWSKYKVTYFEEKLKRDYKNILKISAGLEHLKSTTIFGQKIDTPIRVGLIFDPQPMKKQKSIYYYFTFGTGIHWKRLFLDAGGALGKESGSGNSLSAKKISVSLSIMI